VLSVAVESRQPHPAARLRCGAAEQVGLVDRNGAKAVTTCGTTASLTTTPLSPRVALIAMPPCHSVRPVDDGEGPVNDGAVSPVD
jgi:hypothetical protein